jgi:HEAT repeat protein
VLYTPLVALVLYILMDPFSRQWLIGPKIDGVPLCYWQEALRVHADPDSYRNSLMARVAALVGVTPRPGWARELPPEAAIATVALRLIDDPSPRVRARLGWFLREDVSPEAEAAMLRLLDDAEPSVRVATANACARHPVPPVRDAVRARLVQMLDDPDGECRLVAAIAMCQQTNGQSPDAERLLRAALAETDFNLRRTAIWCLCHHGARMPESLPMVRDRLLTDPVRHVRIAGSQELHEFGAAAVPVLERLLDDPEPRVRANACQGLGKLGAAAREAVPALRLRLTDPDADTRIAAGDALRQIDKR